MDILSEPQVNLNQKYFTKSNLFSFIIVISNLLK